MSYLPFRRVEFPGGGLWPAPMARSFTGLRVFVRSNIAFVPLRGSILRLRRAPSLRGCSAVMQDCLVS